MSMTEERKLHVLSETCDVLADEGFRLFFPLAALHAAAWPLLWVVAFEFSLPFAHAIPPGLWHVHEMIIGTFGAALIGFITTAVPEWTDTERVHGRALLILACLWGSARLLGVLGIEGLGVLGALCDLLWLGALVFYLAKVSLQKRSTRLVGFLFWITCLMISEAVTRYAFFDIDAKLELATRAAHLSGFVFLGILGIALARITVPVTNLVLDPSEQTSPFRPHPGRMNLAPGVVAALVLAEAVGLSQATTGYLFIAAGATFMDRIAEAFIGRQCARSEILVLAGASGFAGLGLMLIGASRLGMPFSELPGLHLALMGGLGLGVLAVFSIAGLRHTGQALVFFRQTRAAILLMVAAVMTRVIPELWPTEMMPAPPYAFVALLWAGAFLLWLRVYWPLFSDRATFQHDGC